MLHQLEFKHQVELQYKEGIVKMAKLYQADGRTADAVKMVRTGMRIFPTNLELYRLYGEIGRRGD